MENTRSDKKMSVRSTDLPDSKQDQEKLKQETFTIDMPEVKDIPGQEHIRVPDMREMQDVTVSSADEEAEDLLSEINTGSTGSEETGEDSEGIDGQAEAGEFGTGNRGLDNSDGDNDQLNEKGTGADRFGEDLDVPGAELDDNDEEIGEEDEENNQYSRPD